MVNYIILYNKNMSNTELERKFYKILYIKEPECAKNFLNISSRFSKNICLTDRILKDTIENISLKKLWPIIIYENGSAGYFGFFDFGEKLYGLNVYAKHMDLINLPSDIINTDGKHHLIFRFENDNCLPNNNILMSITKEIVKRIGDDDIIAYFKGEYDREWKILKED